METDSEHTFKPKHGLTQVLHWRGPGWYGSVGSQDATHAWRYAGEWDQDGFPRGDEEETVWNTHEGLGTPFYLKSVSDFAGEDIPVEEAQC